MKSKSFLFEQPFYDYLIASWLREPDILARLREETAPMENAGMQISPEQGQFMGMLVKFLGVRNYLEIGVFTGYSSLSVALALPPEGRIVACDVSEEFTTVARRYWTEAGVSEKVELRLAPALDTLASLAPDSFDFMFIDADKPNYDAYFEHGLKLVRKGGLIAIDNVFWSGKVADPSIQDDNVDAIRKLNCKLHQDDRIDLSVVPIGDGLTLARRR